jgi:hypothetical protein
VQVLGARLTVRAREGTSPTTLARALRCHGGRASRGEERSASKDPFWLPDSWVDIDVKPAGGYFVVTLNARSVAKNLEVLHRANAFAAQGGSIVH